MPERFARRKLEDQEIWLDFEGGRFYGLNETASEILEAWQAGIREPGLIADRLAARFEVTREEALAAVGAFLREAQTRGLGVCEDLAFARFPVGKAPRKPARRAAPSGPPFEAVTESPIPSQPLSGERPA